MSQLPIKAFGDLQQEVILADLCKECGGCVSFCTAGTLNALELGTDGLPRYADEEKCLSCGICYMICPETRDLDEEVRRKFGWTPPIGIWRSISSARTTDMATGKPLQEQRPARMPTGQSLIPGDRGQDPEGLEIHRTTKTGLEILLRPVRRGDEPLLAFFFHSLSEETLYRRFFSVRRELPYERLQRFVNIDHTKEVAILAVIEQRGQETVIGLAQYFMDESTHTAELGLVVRDDYQNRGVGTELLSHLIYLARRRGLVGLTAEVLVENRPMLHLVEKAGLDVEKKLVAGVWELKLAFQEGYLTKKKIRGGQHV
jgi:RimJ/RimL family protein N-acetyltransferase/NAD-dependent dihydropyrimidine dehydrogenase PreA subunit